MTPCFAVLSLNLVFSLMVTVASLLTKMAACSDENSYEKTHYLMSTIELDSTRSPPACKVTLYFLKLV